MSLANLLGVDRLRTLAHNVTQVANNIQDSSEVANRVVPEVVNGAFRKSPNLMHGNVGSSSSSGDVGGAT